MWGNRKSKKTNIFLILGVIISDHINEIKCYILITLMYMPNTCRLVWNKNYMLSEISVKVSGRKLVGPAETDIV